LSAKLKPGFALYGGVPSAHADFIVAKGLILHENLAFSERSGYNRYIGKLSTSSVEITEREVGADE